MIDSPAPLRENLDRVIAAIVETCRGVGRDPDEVLLVAVAKGVAARAVRWAVEAGARDIGENYVKELAEKREEVQGARWHYVGALQSHTAHRVADLAHVVHGLQPGRAAERLAARAARDGRRIPVLVQVDLAGRRTGVPDQDAVAFARRAAAMEGIEVRGLMTLPPEPQEPEDARPYFVRLRELSEELRRHLPDATELSMGMSLDFQVAVEEGATMVRIGTALFGERRVE